MPENQIKHAKLNRDVAKISLELRKLRRHLTPQGIAKLIQVSASVEVLKDHFKPLPDVDENACERGVYNER